MHERVVGRLEHGRQTRVMGVEDRFAGAHHHTRQSSPAGCGRHPAEDRYAPSVTELFLPGTMTPHQLSPEERRGGGSSCTCCRCKLPRCRKNPPRSEHVMVDPAICPDLDPRRSPPARGSRESSPPCLERHERALRRGIRRTLCTPPFRAPPSRRCSPSRLRLNRLPSAWACESALGARGSPDSDGTPRGRVRRP